MTGERDVRELESRVEELQATVRGLTEELVEANERLRMLEERVAGETAEAGKPESTDVRAEEPKPEESQRTEKEMEETGLSDDIIVA